MTSGDRNRSPRGKRNSLRWQILSTLSRRSLQPTFESLEERKLMAVNIGAVRPDPSDANHLLQHYLDTQPLATGDPNAEILFHYGFSSTSNNGVGAQGFDDVVRAGDLSGLGFDQAIVVRPNSGALQWLGDTDRDTTQEYLFRFGSDGMTPLIADMNGDGIDDVIAVDRTNGANDLMEWYVHYGSAITPYPTNDSTLSIDAQFTFGVEGDSVAAVGGVADVPQVGDINGDGRADAIAVRLGATTKTWYVAYAGSGASAYPNSIATTLTVSQTISGFGANAAVPVVGDWDNDGDDNIGAINDVSPSLWNLDTNGGGAAEITKQFGLSGDQYVVGRWADVLWQGGVDQAWDNGANWSGGTTPSSSSLVGMDQPSNNNAVQLSSIGANTGTLASNEAIQLIGGTLTVTQPSTVKNSVSIAGGSLRLDAGLQANAFDMSAGTMIINVDNPLTNLSSINMSGGAIFSFSSARTLANPVSLTGELTIGGINNLTLSGSISGTGGLTKEGTASLILSGGNTYTGPTNITAGTVLVNGFNALNSTTAVSIGNAGTLDVNATGGFGGNIGSLAGSGTLLLGNAPLSIGSDNTSTLFSGTISRSGQLVKEGTGVFTLSGTLQNGGNLTINQGTVRLGSSERITDTRFVAIGNSGTLDLNGFSETIGGISGGAGSKITLGSGTLTVGGLNISNTFFGDVSGTGGLVKTGTGTLSFERQNTFTGPTLVSQGTVRVNNSFASPLSVASGAVLGGSGQVSAAVTAESGGKIAPGNSPGILQTGDFNLQSGSQLEIEIGGLTPGNTSTNHDQVSVTGSVTLGGSISALRFNGYQPLFGTSYVIISNDGTDAVNGTFAGLPEGSTFYSDSVLYRVSYIGGTGNDVVITSLGQRFVVSNTNDSGSGSLRQAIIDANSNANKDSIVFSLAGAGPFTIAVSSALPAITDAVQIDAREVAGYSGSPLIVLDGTSAGAGTDGLQITAANSLVAGFSIINFSGDGIEIDGGDNNTIAGNFIGIDSDGSTTASNGGYGVLLINGALGNTIGGSTTADRNILSGQTSAGGAGVGLIGVGTNGNKIQGNYIGTNAGGTAARGNEIGVSLFGDAGSNIIGTDGDGNNDQFEGNLISGNITGINLQSNIDDLVIAGNWIGLNAAGTGVIGNTVQGIRVFEDSTSQNLRVGTNADGVSDVFERNVITGNGSVNVFLPGTSTAVIAGNYIGTNAAGTAALGSVNYGVSISLGSTGIRVGTNGDGVNDEAERNVISGHTIFGVGIDGATTTLNSVAGNLIGTNATGNIAIANATGVQITGGATNNKVGGATAAYRNVIAGSTNVAKVYVESSNGNTIQNNFIGTNLLGDASLGGASDGVQLFLANSNVVRDNLISGNANGVTVGGGTSTSNTIAGNFIGTNAAGDSAIPNTAFGVWLVFGDASTVGGTNAVDRNLISGNANAGIRIESGANDHQILGNWIGVNDGGNAAIPNLIGVSIAGNSNGTTIGGSVAGAKNLISGNTTYGLRIDSGTDTSLQNNYVGVRSDGSTSLPNGSGALNVAAGATLKGTGSFSGNVTNQGSIAPGNSPGIITINGNYSQSSTASLQMELQGTSPSTPDFDQLVVNGSVTLAGSLEVILLSGFLPSQGNSFKLIDNDGVDPISGTFSGLAEGTTFIVGNSRFSISYVGGTGNDVVLTGLGGVYTVTTTADSGAGSLRQAIADANSHSGFDTVEFDSGLSGQITLTSGQLTISDSVSIDASNLATGITLSGGNTSRIFSVSNGVNFSLSSLTVTNGREVGSGGAMRNLGTTALSRVTFANNTSLDDAGAIVNFGTLTISNSTFAGNNSSNDGGAIRSIGSLTIVSSTFANNHAGIAGGAIRNDGTMQISSSIVADNSANQSGPDIFGTVISGGYNLIESTNNLTITGATTGNVLGQSPLLGTLQNNGGTTSTIALLAGSPAIGVGDQTLAGSFDQRGTLRNVGVVDIGAYQTSSRFLVSNTNNSGAGSLRQALLDANSNVGRDLVVFNIPVSDPNYNSSITSWTIAPTAALPTITESVVLNATTQSGFVNRPVIELSGNLAGSGVNGFTITAAQSVVQGFAINRFTASGISISGSTAIGNVVVGNYIGTDVTGTSVSSNSGVGVLISAGATGNRIGTDSNGSNDTAERNVISGNNSHGVNITGFGTSNNLVAGNYLGTNAAGNAALRNIGSGVIIQAGATNNTVGGTTLAARNVISGNSNVNTGRGVFINNTGTNFNTVIGNFVGLNAAGTDAIANDNSGVLIGGGARFNTIGGATTAERNYISGNGLAGVAFTGANASSNVVRGNWIGLDVSGTIGIPNLRAGIGFVDGSSGNSAIGNVVSGNQDFGIVVQKFAPTGTGSSNNTIRGNIIGLDPTGSFAIPNIGAGVHIQDSSTGNVIGGTTAADRNIISGNTTNGVAIVGAAASGNQVTGNYIGTDLNGVIDRGNTLDGVQINGAPNNVIGGAVAGAGNLVSGNDVNGVSVLNVTTGATTIQGNLIGTTADGMSALGNRTNGVFVLSSTNTQIGGSTAGARNVIAASTDVGFWFDDGNGVTLSSTSGNRVQGNYIGTNKLGTGVLGNADAGIGIYNSTGEIIGGSLPGEGNLISGNARDGLQIASSSGSVIQGNRIGSNASGTDLLGSQQVGMMFHGGTSSFTIGGASDWSTGSLTGAGNLVVGSTVLGMGVPAGSTVQGNVVGLDVTGNVDLGNDIGMRGGGSLIGGAAPQYRNVISGNRHGIYVDGATGTVVEGNYIGTDQTGLLDRGNSAVGILISGQSTPSTGIIVRSNVVSGNDGDGVVIAGSGVTANQVIGNLIGTDKSGLQPIGNSGAGVYVEGADGNIIGGSSTGARNIISGNAGDGVLLALVTQIALQGNYIGLNLNGDAPIGNLGSGIALGNLTAGATIGGAGSGQGNVISGNAGNGILVGPFASDNSILGNLIGTNPSGSFAIGNQLSGILLNGTGTIVGGQTDSVGKFAGNLISGNVRAGISTLGSGSTIIGNMIGLNADGVAAIANQGGGIGNAGGGSSLTQIGGVNPRARNVIAGNAAESEVSLYGADRWVIQGNFIGTNAFGSARIAGSVNGIRIDNGGFSSLIGGNVANAGNVISGYLSGSAIHVLQGSDNTVIAGNLIGTDLTGTAVIGNSNGIRIDGYAGSDNINVDNTRIGTDGNGVGDEFEGNIIGGSGVGIFVVDASPNQRAINTRIAGNRIGTDGVLDLGNSVYGIYADTASLTIGGTSDVFANLIAFNGVGIAVSQGSSGVSIRRNSIYSNDGLGIDLGNDGVTANDNGDADVGANGLQNYASLSAPAAGGQTRVTGQLNSAPNSTFNIDFYASAQSNPSGFGEGKRFLGSISVTTNLSGLVSFDQLVPGLTIRGDFVSAIVTDANGNSSEFSPAVVADSIAPPTVDSDSLILTEITEDEDLFGLPTTTFVEGRAVRLDGLFIDAALADSHTVRIDWGDGTSQSVLSIPAGPRGFAAEHIYADDRPSGTPQDVYAITIFVSNDASNASGLATTNVTIVNSVPQLAPGTTLSNANGFEGDTLTLTGSFVDPGSDIHTLRVDWGDGSGIQTIQLPVGARTFSVPHKFIDDSRTINIWLNDDDSLAVFSGETLEVAISNRSPSPQILGSLVGVEGNAISLAAVANDPGTNDSASFSWVVSLASTPIAQGTGTNFTFVPINEGVYSIQLTATDDEGATGTVIQQIVVSNAAPLIQSASLAFEDAVTGANLTQVQEGTAFVLTGSFNDSGVEDSHSVEIDWGDGSPLTLFNLPKGVTAFASSHAYADDNPTGTALDQYPIRVRVIDDQGASTATVRNTVVANAPPEVRIVDNGSDGTTIRLRAELKDRSPSDTYQILWEVMGTTPLGLPPSSATSLSVEFPRVGTSEFINATVTVTDDDLGVGSDTTTIVLGTNQNDSITVSPSVLSGLVTVQVNSGASTATAQVPEDNTVLILGQQGADTITISPALQINTSIDGGAGNDSIFGGANSDTINGGAGNDSIISGAGADIVDASEGNDTVNSGEGDDKIIIGGFSDKTLIDSGGVDTIDFSRVSAISSTSYPSAESGLIVDLSLTSGQVQSVRADGSVSLTGQFENAIGTKFSDKFYGNSGSNLLFGGSGNDSIYSGGGGDSLGTGNDSIDGGQGNDLIFGGAVGNDSLSGGEGNDSIYGSGGGSSTNPVPGTDTLAGGAGNDLIFGGAFGNDSIDGGSGNDTIRSSGGDPIGGTGNDTIGGGDGNDLIFGGFVGNDSIAGGDGNDSIYGSGANPTLGGAQGNDTIGGGQGNDLIFGGGFGNDSLDGGAGNDSIYSSGGNDSLGGENTLIGGDGNDLIFGAAVSNDSINGGSGDDTINAATGNDLIFGGLGNVSVVGSGGTDSISGGEGNDLIFGGFGNDTIDGGSGNDTIRSGGGDQTIIGGGGNDLIFGGAIGNDTVDGGLGDDTITGGSGNSTLLGGSGNDSIVSSSGNDLIFGGLGNDTLRGGTGDVSISGAEGNDLIFGGAVGNDTLDGGSGNDTIRAGGGNETLSGGTGNDLIFGGAFGNDTLDGGAGSDTITGGQGNSTIAGGSGNDLIFGGAVGTDSVDGGAGNDSIYASGGNDTLGQNNTLVGGDGNDLIFGGTIGNDSIDGGAGNDTIHSAAGNDLIFGGSIGNVTLISTSGNDSIRGGAGNDLIFGAAVGNDTIDGGVGNDTIYASQGNDLIFAGLLGNTTIAGSGGDDSVSGGSGNDLIFGGAVGNDTLDGGVGDDTIEAAGGNDLIFGGLGNDTIESGAGDESIIAGEGNDLIFGLSIGSDTIDGGAGNDSIQGSEGNDLIFGGLGNDTIDSGSGSETIYGGDGNDLIFGGSVGNDSMDAGAGNDTVIAGDGSGVDTIDGSSGNDLIYADVSTNATLTADRLTLGGAGEIRLLNIESTQLIGNSGNNRIDVSGSALNNYIVGGLGNDTLIGGSGRDTLIAGGGVDQLSGGAGGDLYWFTGSDTGSVQITESSSGGIDTLDFSMMTSGVRVDLNNAVTSAVTPNLTITIIGEVENAIGSDFNDTLIGNSLDNHLIGQGGQDLLQGGAGNDRLESGRRRTVFFDFDSASEVGEHVYTASERAAIVDRVKADYAPFDIEFVTTRPASGKFVTIVFNAAVFLPGSQFALGGISERIGWRELAGSGTVQVDVNGFFGTSANRLPATTENFIALSSTIAAHELAHTYGLRHEDAFGPPGSGIFVGAKNAQRYRPVFTGPTAAVESKLHLISSPASIGTTLVDALGNPYFGEREALKLAFAENGSVVSELADPLKSPMTLGNATVLVQPLGSLPAVSVPNTLMPGAMNFGRELTAAASSVVGEIKLGVDNRSENDYYSFSGSKNDVVTIEVLSQTLRHRFSNPIDSIVRVFNAVGEKVAYYSSFTGAFNDDALEPTDSVLIDLVLPADGTYYVEVDTFSFAAPEFLSYQPGFDIAGYSARFPNDPAVTDRDRGQYELLIYRFDGTTPVSAGDTLVGGLGSDQIFGNSGKETVLGFNSAEDLLFDSSGAPTETSSPPTIAPIGNQTGFEGTAITFAVTASDLDDDFANGWSLQTADGFNYAAGATINPATGLVTFVPIDSGLYAVRVVATDSNGLSSSQLVQFIVSNVAPQITNVSISSVRVEGSSLIVTASATDAAGSADALTYHYEVLKNGSLVASQTGLDLTSFNFVPADNGDYELRLSVSDEDGGTQSVSNVFNVANVSPTTTLQSAAAVNEGSAINVSLANLFDASSADLLFGLKYSFATSIDGLALTYADASSVSTAAFPTNDNGTVTVFARVFDKDGGFTDYSKTILVNNVAPTAIFSNGGAVNEGNSLTVNFSGASDNSSTDVLAGLRYSIATSSAGLAASYSVASTIASASFPTADSGTYVIYGRVFDKDGGFTDYTTTVTVSNVAPTVTLAVAPSTTVAAGTSVTITSSTFDPAGLYDPLTFAWVITKDGNPFASQNGGGSYVLAAPAAGVYLISLTVSDGDGGVTTSSRTITVTGAANVPPTVQIFAPDDNVLSNVAWFRFVANDSDAADANGTFTYTVNWGDGTSSVVIGTKDKWVSHTYATLSPNGYFTVKATAQDARGATGPVTSTQFIVSGYLVVADPLNSLQSILVVVGSTGEDRIKLKERGDDYLKITIRNEDHDVRVRGMQSIGNVTRVLVFGWNEDDEITIDDDLYLPVEVWGGAGDDKIKGGSGNDIIFGEAGDDVIYGGDGRDLLFGGLGEDRLYGDQNDDILVAGFTVFESAVPTNFAYARNLTFEQQRAAVEAIMAEWSSNRSYALRVANIRGTGTGTRANGTNFLIASNTLANSTVFDDDAEDKLWGDNGLDWFFYNLDGDLGTKKDRLNDRGTNESVDDLDRWF